MKKQVRRTIGGLFLASAIVVAAIPVERTSAKSVPGTDYAADTVVSATNITFNKNLVRAVHYKDDTNNAYESINGVDADANWRSKVPYIKANEQVYIDETDTYRFAFIRDGSGDQFAVILGINDSNIDNSGNLTIQNEVDAYYAYTNNTSSGRFSYCAVNREGNFLYYASSAQQSDPVDGLKYTASFYEQSAAIDDTFRANTNLTASEIAQTQITNGTFHNNEEFWTKQVGSSFVPEFTNAMNEEAGYKDSGLNVGDPAYRVSFWAYNYDPSAGVADPNDESILHFAGTWQNKFAYFPVYSKDVLTYVPCYRDNVDKWSPGGIDQTLYYYKTSGAVPTAAEVSDPSKFSVSDPTGTTGRVYDCKVKYIGMQTILPVFDTNGEFTGKWTVTEPTTETSTDGKTVTCYPDRGVFSNKGKLINLTINPSLSGIGDFAFYQCTSLQSVTFSNQLNTIGNGAFYGCTKLASINPNDESPWMSSDLAMIGASAFENCINLQKFSVPIHVFALGDRAFRGCNGLKSINLFDSAGDSNLNVIGYNIFNGCGGLEEIIIPRSLSQKVPVHYFDGCTGLKRVALLEPSNLSINDNDTAGNFTFDIIDGDPFVDTAYGGTHSETVENGTKAADGTYTVQPTFHHGAIQSDGTYSNGIKNCDIDDWLATLDPNFYFESCDNTSLHTTAKDHSAAFKYDNTKNKGNYEIVMVCDEDPSHENTFVVDTSNNLVSSNIDKDCHVITIPATIGGYSVSTIGSTGFNNNCSLRRVYIPGTVQRIDSDAFKGCHNLQTVYFTDTNYNLTIGDGAFDTQAFEGAHPGSCVNSENNNGLDAKPKLSFVGAVDVNYAPFQYAMNANNNINVGSQPTTYITYYSGWPSFQTVMFNPDRIATGDENELVEYPTKKYLSTIITDWKGATTPAAKAAVLNKYPFLTAEQLTSMELIKDYWADPTAHPLETEDQKICASSIESIDVYPGIEHIKEGLFSNLDSDGNLVSSSIDSTDSSLSDIGSNIAIKSIKLNSVKTVEPYTFAGMKNLESFDMVGGNEIGDYAFWGDSALSSVSISGDVNTLGVRPFRDCTSLDDIYFAGSNFSCQDYIIYDNTNGKAVVECLENRSASNAGASVSADEMSGVTSLYPEAFMNCDGLSAVDLSKSSVKEIPERTFAGTDRLNKVTLPNSVVSIKKDAFLDTDNLDSVILPNPALNGIAADAFAITVKGNKGAGTTYDEFYSGYQSDGTATVADANNPGTKTEFNPYVSDKDAIKNYRTVTFYTPDPGEGSSGPVSYAENPDYPYIVWKDQPVPCTVTFWDYTDPTDNSTSFSLKSFKIDSGSTIGSVYMPNDPSHPGSEFKGWKYTDENKNVTIYTSNEVADLVVNGDMEFIASYKNDDCTVIYYTILSGDRTEVDRETVAFGTAASPPTSLPSHVDEGYEIVRDDDGNIKWVRDPSSTNGFKNITDNPTTFTATYEKISSSDYHTVRFLDTDETTVYATYQVPDGGASPTPPTPTKSGYVFKNWLPQDFSNITADTDIYAVWEKDESGNNNGGNGGNGGSSGGSGGGGTQYIPYPVPVSGNTNGSTSGNSNNGVGPIFRVTVVNGSGSGNYVAGSGVVIAANDPPSGKAFDKWTTADVTLASTTLPATTFTMPNKNVTVTANYKDAKSSSSNAVRYATGNSSRPPATGRTATGSTQVQVNKGGVSNVDLASATVRGSTDSFIIKVTETNEATNAVENALNNRYGSLDALKYWPCDISLYDSTGTTKITDTTGLSIEITLPIPDELRQYGGNNKVGAVANNQLEDLGTRFNTINGTPTVTFTATHFSPYVIYADTNNLVASEMLDASPKTGDPIHPKWFLAIALFAGSIFMFLKKDKKTVAVTA